MAGLITKTFEELEQMKYTVIEHFGITGGTKKGFEFFLTETMPPKAFGYDCRDYTWYSVQLNTEQDFEQLNNFLNRLFDRSDINIPSGKTCMVACDQVENQIKQQSRSIDWGACHVVYMPISASFQKLYACKTA